MLKKSLFILSLFMLLTGCATQPDSIGERRTAEQRNFSKNYIVGTQRTATVGDVMIKVQDYWTEGFEYPTMIPDRSVTLTGGPVRLSLNAGQKYPVRGSIVQDGMAYSIVSAFDNNFTQQAVMVKPDGTLHNRVMATNPYLNGYVQVIYTFNISDPNARLVRDTGTKVIATKGYENFEILYTGVNGSSLNLTYREFSSEGMARVAFYQNLTYEASAKTIAFKDFRIAVDRANSESITFTVLSDGR
jgi:hypothetical protein